MNMFEPTSPPRAMRRQSTQGFSPPMRHTHNYSEERDAVNDARADAALAGHDSEGAPMRT